MLPSPRHSHHRHSPLPLGAAPRQPQRAPRPSTSTCAPSSARSCRPARSSTPRPSRRSATRMCGALQTRPRAAAPPPRHWAQPTGRGTAAGGSGATPTSVCGARASRPAAAAQVGGWDGVSCWVDSSCLLEAAGVPVRAAFPRWTPLPSTTRLAAPCPPLPRPSSCSRQAKWALQRREAARQHGGQAGAAERHGRQVRRAGPHAGPLLGGRPCEWAGAGHLR